LTLNLSFQQKVKKYSTKGGKIKNDNKTTRSNKKGLSKRRIVQQKISAQKNK